MFLSILKLLNFKPSLDLILTNHFLKLEYGKPTWFIKLNPSKAYFGGGLREGVLLWSRDLDS